MVLIDRPTTSSEFIPPGISHIVSIGTQRVFPRKIGAVLNVVPGKSLAIAVDLYHMKNI